MSENRFDVMRRLATETYTRANTANVQINSINGDALFDLVEGVRCLSMIIVELADEAEKAAFGKYAEGRSTTA